LTARLRAAYRIEGVAKIVAKGGDALKGKVIFKAANNLSLGQATCRPASRCSC